MGLVFAVDDPQRADVRTLLEAHLAFARENTPPEHVHALGLDGLLDRSVTLYSARRDGTVLGVGALRHLDDSHAELNSIHTIESARGQGVGRAMVIHLLKVAAARGYQRVSLETGTQDAFAPARQMYAKAGFTPCYPFGDYTVNPWSTCMTLTMPAARNGP
jgi:putative acetyltransferase